MFLELKWTTSLVVFSSFFNYYFASSDIRLCRVFSSKWPLIMSPTRRWLDWGLFWNSYFSSMTLSGSTFWTVNFILSAFCLSLSSNVLLNCMVYIRLKLSFRFSCSWLCCCSLEFSFRLIVSPPSFNGSVVCLLYLSFNIKVDYRYEFLRCIVFMDFNLPIFMSFASYCASLRSYSLSNLSLSA